MKLTATVLRCSSRKVNSSAKETHVTNLLVLDEDSSSGSNYSIELWGEQPHEFPVKSEIMLTVTGVVNKNGGVPAFRGVIAAQDAPAAA